MIRFANFELSRAHRQLRRDGKPVGLRERAFEVLLALLEQAGQVVSKRELCRRAWPGREVDENNLQVEILGLRKLLGTHAIVTASGRGYQFALPVESVTTAIVPDAERILIGRDEDLRALEALLAAGVLVTLTGEGGIGKTQLARVLATRREGRLAGSTCVVALDAATDGEQPLPAIADALRLPSDAGADGAAALCSALRERRLLLVLDGCDRAVQEVAELASAILNACPGISLLATSREVLRVPGERVYRLGPLALELRADAAVTGDCDAVRLFRHYQPAIDADLARSDAAHATVFDICRQLEGNPLAIKLAATRALDIGLDPLRRRLAERLSLLVDADPAVLPRQRSLRASFEWSHQRLPAIEQAVFRGAATLAQPFKLEQLLALQRRLSPDPWEVMEALARLVDKSLVAVDNADPPNYRLSEIRDRSTLANCPMPELPVRKPRAPGNDASRSASLSVHRKAAGRNCFSLSRNPISRAA